MQTQINQLAAQGVPADSPFQFNPFTLISLLSPGQHCDIAGKAFIAGQTLFKKGRHKDYDEFLTATFKNLFASASFLSLDADTQSKQYNMAIELITFLSEVKELDKTINNQIVLAVKK